MRIGVVAIDSRGGVQPLLGLALRLREAGHEPRFAVPRDVVSLIEDHGVAAQPLSVDVRAMLQRREASLGGRRAQIAMARKELPGQLVGWMREARSIVQGVDVVISGTAGLIVASPVAEALGVPLIEAHLQPYGPPTTKFPGVNLPGVPRWAGGPGRWLSHVLTNASLSLPLRGAIGRARTEALGLPKRPSDGPQPLALYAYSPHVVPKPPSWGPDRHVTGYWTLPVPVDQALPPALEQFLAAGPPPAVIGFGSMPLADPQAVARLAVAAARRAGARVVLLGGWGGLVAEAAPDVLSLPEAPHSLLFPRASVVVHHGGAGTTGATVTAGIPSVVVTWGADQPFWAMRLGELGVAAAPIARHDLTEERLAAALTNVLSDAAVASRARELSDLIAAEDGTGAAAALVSTYGDRWAGSVPA